MQVQTSDTKALADLRGLPRRLQEHVSPFVVGEPAFYEPLAVATDKGDAEFDAKIAEIVAAMHEDGTLTALSEKWYGVDLTSVD